jgi:hypothetical protein
MLARTIIAAMSLVVLATDAFAFEGSYSFNRQDVSRTARIVSTGDNVYRVDLGVTARNCTGELEAYGEVEGGRLVVTPPTQDETCRVSITRRGSSIIVNEEDSCLEYHGASCDFSGTLTSD